MRLSPSRGSAPAFFTGRRLLDAGIVVVAACWTLWPFLVNGGIPTYQHDWSWPFQNQQSCDALASFGSTWIGEGLGHANPFANDNLVNRAMLSLGCVLPESLALRFYLFCCALAASAGAIVLARGLAGGNAAPRIAAFFYIASPPFFNKVSAGHIAFWAAYAIFPWIGVAVVRVLRSASYEAWALAAVLFSFSFVQPQFYVLSALLAIVLCFACRASWRTMLYVAGAYAIALLLSAPALYAGFRLQHAFSYTIPTPQLGWETLQSTDVFAAFRMLGYISHYADDAYADALGSPLYFAALSAVCVAALFGCFALRRRGGYALGLMASIGILVLMGVHGPFAAPLAWAYGNVAAAALFRELYHAAPLISLSYSVGLSLFLRRFENGLVTPVVWGLSVVAFLPLAVPGHSLDLAFRKMPEADARAIQHARTFPPGRVLPLPYRMPIAFERSRRSGVDVLSYVDREHPSIGEYAPTPELDTIFALLRHGSIGEAKRRLAAFGVSGVLWRPDLHASVAEQFLGAERPSANVARATFNQDGRVFAQLAGRTGCRDESCASRLADARPLIGIVDPARPPRADDGTFTPVHLEVSRAATSPLEGWVSLRSWNWLEPSWAAISDVVAVTDRGGTLRIAGAPGTRLQYVANAPATLCDAAGCRVLPTSSGSGLFSLARPETSFTVEGPAAIGAIAGPIRLPALANARMLSGTWVNNVDYRAQLDGHGTVFLEFRSTFDDGWHLGVEHAVARHVRSDGFANAWMFALDGSSKVFLYYSPQRSFERLVIFERVLYGMIALSFFFALLHRVRRGVSTCLPQ